MKRYTVTEAAWLLGVGTDAIRKRIQRNTIKHEKVNGAVYVWLDADETRRDRDATEALVEVYRDQLEDSREQIEFLRRELERKDAILLTMAQRIPELEPASEPRDGRVTASEDPAGTEAPPEEERRSWLRRFFGF